MKIMRLYPDAILPVGKTIGSAGFDLCLNIDYPVTLWPGDNPTLLGTGIAVWIEDPKIAGFIVPRSGLANARGITLSNGVGLIDSDYQGELMVSLINISNRPYVVNKYDRIAQLVFTPVLTPHFEIVDSFEPTSRGTNGFGSTGI